MFEFDSMPILAMLVIGLMGAGHCIGMCGGIVAALGFATDDQRSRWPTLLSYNLGRITSYGLIGALVGLLGLFGREYLSLGPSLRIFAGVLLILMGLYLAGWWHFLSWLERGGQHAWRHIQPFATRLFRVRTVGRAFLFGMLWGWLPCGLVYSALAYAAATAHPVSSALSMMAFGLGTLPVMLAGGVFSSQLKRWLQVRALRTAMGMIVIVFGAWTLWNAMAHNHQREVTSEQNDGVSAHQHMHH
ncbi:sulfite exporter TauE/SafE family protein [uncultured Porticoccus sp.]|uniref:sulfite exporter TauE/SafE family protein n=1 Tax=Porticoccus sp. TaxID=2024853 RepID=UPI000C0E9E7C|nr:MAG: cytochrome biogenesis protein [Porticoccus sp.]|tara:strand:+ start:15191 stop:15925 length:735 start_codon:yes stop_codon:yes gene_type:complete